MTDFTENLLRQNAWFLTAMLAFIAAGLLYSLAAVRKQGEKFHALGSVAFGVATVALLGFMTARWIEAGRPPFKSLYESLVLFAACMAILYVAVERFYKIAWLGAGTGLFGFGLLIYAIAKADAEIINLPAALQSIWFVPHVVVYFFGYAAVFLAFASALMHLWRPQAQFDVRTAEGGIQQMTYAGFMHRTILLGFVLLTAGLVIGAVWAKAAWGDYWVWDPKENWALVSWLVFAIYLHLRLGKGFGERTAAWMTIGGFATIAFTYLGMHLLPTAEQSAHVYQ